MPKAYWIARVDVADLDGYKPYVETAAPAFKRFGAKFLARGGRTDAVEGAGRARNVIIEFKDFDTALACYNSPEYTEAKAYRQAASMGEIVIVEAYEGPQPNEA